MYDWEEHNYRNDHRNTESAAQAKFDACCDKATMTYSFHWGEDENGDERSFTLPIKRVVCPTCNGEGKHVNPSIDAGGIGGDDEFWEDDQDWEEEDEEGNPVSRYRSGVYDVTCYTCHGNNVVLDIDLEAASISASEALEAWEDFCQDQAEYESECAAERRWGC